MSYYDPYNYAEDVYQDAFGISITPNIKPVLLMNWNGSRKFFDDDVVSLMVQLGWLLPENYMVSMARFR